jgi:hypothetical protein
MASGVKEYSHSRATKLGRLLAAAEGYQVLSSEGRFLGVVDHVRYEAHSDHPDFVVMRRRNTLLRRRRVIPFAAVKAVEPRERIVALSIEADSLSRYPLA